jgi:protease I
MTNAPESPPRGDPRHRRVERIELEAPRRALEEAGATTELLSIRNGEIQARDHDLGPAGTFAVDRLVSDASIDDFDALVPPGGAVNPDKLRIDADVVRFVGDFAATGKPVGAICHGPWTLLQAGVRACRPCARVQPPA